MTGPERRLRLIAKVAGVLVTIVAVLYVALHQSRLVGRSVHEAWAAGEPVELALLLVVVACALATVALGWLPLGARARAIAAVAVAVVAAELPSALVRHAHGFFEGANLWGWLIPIVVRAAITTCLIGGLLLSDAPGALRRGRVLVTIGASLSILLRLGVMTWNPSEPTAISTIASVVSLGALAFALWVVWSPGPGRRAVVLAWYFLVAPWLWQLVAALSSLDWRPLAPNLIPVWNALLAYGAAVLFARRIEVA